MKGNARASQYIYIFKSLTRFFRYWPVMTEVVGSSPMIGKHFPHFLSSFSFLTCKQTCKLEFTGFMIKRCLI